jgi:hypothetical protein
LFRPGFGVDLGVNYPPERVKFLLDSIGLKFRKILSGWIEAQ